MTWTTPSRLLPKALTPVAAWDDTGLYVAMRSREEPDSEWIECTEYGDPVWGMMGANVPIIREPDVWTHLPKRKK